MHGDFSRGHRPDRKRGQVYTRALAQERRLLLDSDLNSATDALHERLRGLANHLGCPKGSPDLGFLVTPGRLLAIFPDLDGVVITSANLTVHRSYQNKYLDRYPSLHLIADQGAQGTITIRLRQAFNGAVRVWCRRDGAANVTFEGAALAVPLGPDLQPAAANVANQQDVDITLDDGGEIFIGLIESLQNATAAPVFDYAGGTFYLDGLPLQNVTDTSWLTNAPSGGNFQVNGANLANGNRLLAYLEGWERHVTWVEDLGLLEHALGGDTDTMTRGRATGQVKLAFVPANFDLEAFGRALASPVLTDGTLDVTTPPAPPNPDPCALPVQGGYTGRDNRFYRFEVHTGGAAAVATIKWSRDNGSELFPVTDAPTNAELTFPSNTPLRGGDLVEILTPNSIELGDQTPAVLDAPTTTFTPSLRSVGVLARLVGPTANGGATFTLTNPDGLGVVNLPAHYGPFPVAGLKVRRWNGLIEAVNAPLPNGIEVENGLHIALNGSFSPGDYWQYEARTAGTENDNGVFQQQPHGPERDFAPLALLQFNGNGVPLLLERWLDDRFGPLCELTADDIEFDGGNIGSDSNTVQEIIEEIWEQIGGGCCEFTLEPEPGDAAGPIRDILDDTQGEVTICFEPGVYTFTSTLDVNGRTVILKGCPRAVFVGDGVPRIFNVTGQGRLVLEHLVIYAQQAQGTRVLVDVNAPADVEVIETALVVVPAAGVNVAAIAIRMADEEPPLFDPALAAPPQIGFGGEPGSTVRLHRAVIAAGWGVSARRLDRLAISDSVLECATGGVWFRRATEFLLESSTILAGATLDPLAAWSPADLLSNRGPLLATLGDATVPGNAIADASVCLFAVVIERGHMTGSQLFGDVGFVAVSARVSLHHNRYATRLAAVHMFEASGAAIDGEQIRSQGAGAGITIGQANNLSVSGCEVSGCQVAVRLGSIAQTEVRVLTNVQVIGNRIDEAGIGIHVGPASVSVYAGLLTQVAIAENVVRAAGAGILVNALTIGTNQADALAVQPVAVRVADNMVLARQGIVVAGRDVTVADNVVRLLPQQQFAFFGIVGINTSRLTCETNQIEVSIPQAIQQFMVGPQFIAGNQFNAAMNSFAIEVGNVVQSAAIVISGGAEARVAANVTQADQGIVFRSLVANNHLRLSVKGNEFRCGPVRCDDTDDIVFLDNGVAGEVMINVSDSGQVADNRVRANDIMKLEGDLDILAAAGRWKVADNRADGAINISPGTIGNPWVTPGGFEISVDRFRTLDTIGRLSRDAEFIDLINPPPAGGNPAVQPAAAVREAGAGPAAYAMTDTEWRLNYGRAMESFIAAGASPGLVAVIGGRDVVIINTLREAVYHVQCTANWSRDLEIGIPVNDIRINTASVVQVVSNRADQEMRVKQYTHLVMALNVAGGYPQAGNPQAGAIELHNLEI
jgi:hypothetical protein